MIWRHSSSLGSGARQALRRNWERPVNKVLQDERIRSHSALAPAFAAEHWFVRGDFSEKPSTRRAGPEALAIRPLCVLSLSSGFEPLTAAGPIACDESRYSMALQERHAPLLKFAAAPSP